MTVVCHNYDCRLQSREKQTFNKTFRIKLLIPTLLISNGMFHYLSAPLPSTSQGWWIFKYRSGTRIFLQKSQKNLDPLNKFFEDADKEMALLVSFFKGAPDNNLRFLVPGSRFQSSLGGGCVEKNGLFPFASPYKSEKIHGGDKQLRLKQNSKLC